VRLQKAFERVYVVDWSDGFRDGVPDDWSSNGESSITSRWYHPSSRGGADTAEKDEGMYSQRRL